MFVKLGFVRFIIFFIYFFINFFFWEGEGRWLFFFQSNKWIWSHIAYYLAWQLLCDQHREIVVFFLRLYNGFPRSSTWFSHADYSKGNLLLSNTWPVLDGSRYSVQFTERDRPCGYSRNSIEKAKSFFVIFKSFIYCNFKRSHKTVTSIRLFKNAKMNINTQPPKNMLLYVPSKFAKASAIFLTACCVESGSFVSFMSCPLNIRKF